MWALGKSRWAVAQAPYDQIYRKNFNKWWDGYSVLETKIVLLDDYPCLDQGNVLVFQMKYWCDRYPFIAECKGSHMMINPGKFFFIVTSNYPIDQCFKNPIDIDAIKRRFKEVKIAQGDFYSQNLVHPDFSILLP